MSSLVVVVWLSFFVSSACPAPPLNSDSFPVSKFGGTDTKNEEIRKMEISVEYSKELDEIFKKLFLYINAHFRDTNQGGGLRCETINEDKDHFVFYDLKGKLFPKRKPVYVAEIQRAVGIKKYFEISIEKNIFRIISSNLMLNESQYVTHVPINELNNKTRPITEVENGKSEATNINQVQEAVSLSTGSFGSSRKNSAVKYVSSTEQLSYAQEELDKHISQSLQFETENYDFDNDTRTKVTTNTINNFTIPHDLKTLSTRSSQATTAIFPNFDSNSNISGIKIYKYVTKSENALYSLENKNSYWDLSSNGNNSFRNSSSSTTKYTTPQTSSKVYNITLTNNGNESQNMSTYRPNTNDNELYLTAYSYITSFESIDKKQKMTENDSDSKTKGITNSPSLSDLIEKKMDPNHSITQSGPTHPTKPHQLTTIDSPIDSKEFNDQVSDIPKQFTNFNNGLKKDHLDSSTTFYLSPDYLATESNLQTDYFESTSIAEASYTPSKLINGSFYNSFDINSKTNTFKIDMPLVTDSNKWNYSTERSNSFTLYSSSLSFTNTTGSLNNFNISIETIKTTTPSIKYNKGNPSPTSHNTTGTTKSVIENKITILNYSNIYTEKSTSEESTIAPSTSSNSPQKTSSIFEVSSKSHKDLQNNTQSNKTESGSIRNQKTEPTSSPVDGTKIFDYLTAKRDSITTTDHINPSNPESISLLTSSPQNVSENKVIHTVTSQSPNNYNNGTFNLFPSSSFNHHTKLTSVIFDASNHSEGVFTKSRQEISDFDSKFENHSSPSFIDLYTYKKYKSSFPSSSQNVSENKPFHTVTSPFPNNYNKGTVYLYPSSSFNNHTRLTFVTVDTSNHSEAFFTESQVEISDVDSKYENRSSLSYPSLYNSSFFENYSTPISVTFNTSNHSERFFTKSQLEISDFDSKFENRSLPSFSVTNSQLDRSTSFQTISYNDEKSSNSDQHSNKINEKELNRPVVFTPSLLNTILNLTEQHVYNMHTILNSTEQHVYNTHTILNSTEQHVYNTHTILNSTEQRPVNFPLASSESETTHKKYESNATTFPLLSHSTNNTGKIEHFSKKKNFITTSIAETSGLKVEKSSITPLTTAIDLLTNSEFHYWNSIQDSTTSSYEKSNKSVYNNTPTIMDREISSSNYSLLSLSTSSIRHFDFTYSRSDYNSQPGAISDKINAYNIAIYNIENITSGEALDRGNKSTYSFHWNNSSVTRPVSTSIDNGNTTKGVTTKSLDFYYSDLHKHLNEKSSQPSFDHMMKNQSENYIKNEINGHQDNDDSLVEKSTASATVVIEDEVKNINDLSSKAEKLTSNNPPALVNIVTNQQSSIYSSENVYQNTPLLVSTKWNFNGSITEISTESNIVHSITEDISNDVIVTEVNENRNISKTFTDTNTSIVDNQTKGFSEKTYENTSYNNYRKTLFERTRNKQEIQTFTTEMSSSVLISNKPENLTIQEKLDEGSSEVTTMEIQKYLTSKNTLLIETTTELYDHRHTHLGKNDSVINLDGSNGNTSTSLETTKIANFSYNEKNQTTGNIPKNISVTSIEKPLTIFTTPKSVIQTTPTSDEKNENTWIQKTTTNHKIISPKINSEISRTSKKKIDLEMSTQHYETMASFNNFTFLLPTTDYLTSYLPIRIHPFIVFSEI